MHFLINLKIIQITSIILVLKTQISAIIQNSKRIISKDNNTSINTTTTTKPNHSIIISLQFKWINIQLLCTTKLLIKTSSMKALQSQIESILKTTKTITKAIFRSSTTTNSTSDKTILEINSNNLINKDTFWILE